MEANLSGIVKKGKMEWDNPSYVRDCFSALEGEKVRVKVEKWRNKRSLDQNSYWYGVVLPILMDHCGYDDKEEMNDLMEAKFLSEKVLFGDEYIMRVRHASKLNTKEFNDFIEKVKRWAAQEMDLDIPDPDENYCI